jgi:hypothetical protein
MAPLINSAEIRAGLRFASGIPRLVRRDLSTAQARQALQARLENRRTEFLDLARVTMYENPGSPYRALLKQAGCEFGDLRKLVEDEDVEGALKVLLQKGVYLSLAEFKGRKPAVRGTAVVQSGPDALRNPLTNPHFKARSSGSTGKAVPVTFDLDFIRDRAVNLRLFLESRGGLSWRHATWGVPGSTDLVMLLELAAAGFRSLRWFSQVSPDAPGLHPKYRWSARLMRWPSRWAGRPLPAPEHVPLDDPGPIVCWIRDVLDSGRTPHLTTFVTPGIKVCQAAQVQGVDIAGTQMTLGGEPMTRARLEMLRGFGVVAVPRFLAIESGYIGYGCLAPDASDDNHVIRDFNAVIAAGREGEPYGLPPRMILTSSLRRSVPLIMLNVSLGDEADLARRSCGCPLEGLGYHTHLSRIRSFERLKSGGVTFLDTDVVPILEEALPRRFGGSALDYQLVEQERTDGSPEVVLVVSPAVGPLDSEAVIGAFLEEIGRGEGAERVMGLQWRDGKFVRVERRVPEKTSTGKIKHLLKSRA